MTKVEAIKFGTAWLEIQEKLEGCEMYEFFKMSVKALQEEQKSEWQHDHEILKAHSDGANEMLDTIRAEIDNINLNEVATKYEDRFYGFQREVLKILDKYRGESEVEDV